MFVLIMTVRFEIMDSFSLKDKRSTLKSMTAKLKNKFNISIAEISENDIINFAAIGLSCVSNESKQLDKVAENVINYIDSFCNVEIVEIEREIV